MDPFSQNCKMCGSPLHLAASHSTDQACASTDHDRYLLVANACDYCGWWYSLEKWDSYSYEQADESIQIRKLFFKGIIKKFDLSQTAVPTDLLRRYLATHIEDFRYLHPRKFELLVRDIYRDFFSCEVKHVGGPGDNGVDLFAIIGDQSYLIQAKRRANPDRAESAATVREFIGTLIAHDATRDHIFTTASHYSNSAFSLPACEGVRRHNIDIELKTLGDIFQMLRVANSRLRDPWDLCPRGIEPPSGRKIDGYFSPSGQLHLIDRLDSMALGDGGDVLAELAVTM